jgi:hypothetical protein
MQVDAIPTKYPQCMQGSRVLRRIRLAGLCFAMGLVAVLFSEFASHSSAAGSCIPTRAQLPPSKAFKPFDLVPRPKAPLFRDPLEYTSAYAFNEADAQQEAATLRERGFVSAIYQQYKPNDHLFDRVASVGVEQLGSPEGAAQEMADNAFFEGGSRPKHFRVRGIPGAVGGQRKAKSSGETMIYFTQGNYYYVFDLGDSRISLSEARRGLNHIARGVYRRVQGTPACP